MMNNSFDVQVIIIGAGIAGLAAAWRLKQHGTSPHKKAIQIIKYFRHEDPDYNYIRAVFSHLRKELDVPVKAAPKKLPYVHRG